MTNIQDYFASIKDFRIEKKCFHKLSDILLIALFTYLSNGEDFEDMVLFGETKGKLLPEYLSLENGVPSHDTFNRVFSGLEPEVLRKCLADYGKNIIDVLAQKQICFDGKKLKGVSPKSKGNHGLYIVNAWVAENRICVGQKKVEHKSNEITAIPALIKEIDITDAVVSIDAIGCQRDIATQIKAQKGHYLLAVKRNQLELFDDVVCAFKANKSVSISEEWEYERGRFETRKCSMLFAKETLLTETLEQWTALETLVKIEATRVFKDKESTEVRYYISDEMGQNAKYYNALVRGHWGIENHLHWHLDVTFNEDKCRSRTGNAPENLSTFRKLALQIITDKPDKLSLKKRRVNAAYDIKYLKSLLI
jgi:predicted transposase YbfD/YdcC